MEDLEVQQIAAGLWRWTAPHPDWKPEKGGPGGWERMVGSIYYEAPEAAVLFDPMAPPAGSPAAVKFWAALDRDVERLARPVAVLLANHYHVRSAAEVYERYRASPGASVWAHEAAAIELPVARRFVAGSALPGSVRAFSITGMNAEETVFYIPAHRAVVPADTILGAGAGKLRVAPASWAESSDAGQARYRERFRSELRRLLDLTIDRVLVSHGEPVLEHGHRALAEALEAPAWGE
jgi:glyoxylase-like metal-dependent hydrolase (beta-lactamase superfamily II)